MKMKKLIVVGAVAFAACAGKDLKAKMDEAKKSSGDKWSELVAGGTTK